MEFLKVEQVNTRFMRGNKTSEVFDAVADYYGMGVVCSDEIDYAEAIFSDGFILAMENDLMPIIGSHEVSLQGRKGDVEFHHIIFNDECYKVYFEDIEED